MAGDWLKVCKDTPDKPEILAIAARLNCHPDIAFARLFKLWSWFDSHTTDGVTYSVTKVTLDALLHRDGLCDALVTVGWLIERPDGGLQLPNFGYHNGETAKARAMSAKRQERHRSNRDKSNASSVTNVTGDALPREEKRREEIKDIPPNPQGGGAVVELAKVKKADATPYDEIVRLYHECLPELPRVAKLTDKRKANIRARWSSDPEFQTLAFWEAFFKYVRGSAFLMGQESRFSADLEFLTKESTFFKTYEGKYHNEPQKGKTWN